MSDETNNQTLETAETGEERNPGGRPRLSEDSVEFTIGVTMSRADRVKFRREARKHGGYAAFVRLLWEQWNETKGKRS